MLCGWSLNDLPSPHPSDDEDEAEDGGGERVDGAAHGPGDGVGQQQQQVNGAVRVVADDDGGHQQQVNGVVHVVEDGDDGGQQQQQQVNVVVRVVEDDDGGQQHNAVDGEIPEDNGGGGRWPYDDNANGVVISAMPVPVAGVQPPFSDTDGTFLTPLRTVAI